MAVPVKGKAYLPRAFNLKLEAELHVFSFSDVKKHDIGDGLVLIIVHVGKALGILHLASHKVHSPEATTVIAKYSAAKSHI